MWQLLSVLRIGLLICVIRRTQSADWLQENGTKAIIACKFEKHDQNTTWQVRAGHDFINVAICTFGTDICVDHMPQQYHAEVVIIEEIFVSVLTITNVRINETEYRCLTRFGFIRHTLEVYAQPRNLLCDPVELDYTKKELQFRCGATHVFPSVSAELYIRGVKLSQKDEFSVHCSNEESGRRTLDGFSAECVWRISTVNLEPIKYKYYVNMFPNLSNITGIDVPNAVSQDYTLQLSSPVAVIDSTHCPIGPGVVDGKIIPGSRASCRCVLESPGFPPGQARWYTLHGHQSLGTDDPVDGSSTLDIYNNNPEQSYRCGAESPLKNLLNWGPDYTPVFTTPSSGSETYSLRIEIVAGILAGLIGLTVVIAVAIWKWRCRKRQNPNTTRLYYNRSSEHAQSDYVKPVYSGDSLLASEDGDGVLMGMPRVL